MLKKSFLLLAIIFMITFSVFATVPKKINYQGYLTDNTGNPITTTTPLEITFKIYSTPTTSTALWNATYDVVVVNGKFNVMLGNPDKWGNAKAIPYTVFDGNVKYLGIKVGTDPEMTPRKELVTVAYAYKAHNSQQLDGKPSSDFASSSHNHDSRYYKKSDLNTNDGNVNQSSDPVSWYKIKNMPAGFADGTDNGGGDNLGNHTATQNIKLNGHYLSNDGGNKGIKVYNDGHVNLHGYFYTDSYIVAQTNIEARDGSIKTGSPSSTFSNGDIASTDDICADDDITAEGTVTGKGTSSTYGVRGIGGTYGVRGEKGSNYGYLGSSGYGVYGGNGSGAYGYIGSSNYGVYGRSNSSTAKAVYGYTSSSSSSANAVRGYAPGSAYAGYFNGRGYFSGFLTKAGGGFQIDHPLDPANKFLVHSFVESPDMMNVYNGNVILNANGEAVITLPDWFEALNKDFRYQLTCIGGFAQVYIAEEINNNQFKIAGGKANMKVSWQVTGIRHDAWANANRPKVEVEKKGEQRGKYMHPIEHNVPEELGIDYKDKLEAEKNQQQMMQEEQRLKELEAAEQAQLELENKKH